MEDSNWMETSKPQWFRQAILYMKSIWFIGNVIVMGIVFLTYLEFAEDLVSYIKETSLLT
jgi:hypothetical protein